MNISPAFIFVMISFLIFPFIVSGKNTEKGATVIASFIMSICFSPFILVFCLIGFVLINFFI